MAIQLISRTAGGAAGNGDSGFVSPLIGLPNPNLDWLLASDANPFSPDGTKVLFHSRATNLAGGTDTNTRNDLFLADLVTGAVTRVTSTPAGNAPAGDPRLNDSSYPATAMFGLNGTKVLFTSAAPDLVAGELSTSTTSDLFSYDIASATLSRVTTSTTGGGGNGNSEIVALSDDGSTLVFLSLASNLDTVTGAGTNLWVHDVASGANTRIGTNLLGFKGGVNFDSRADGGRIITADGSKVLFASGSVLDAADTNNDSDVFIFDTATGTSERITAGSIVPNGGSRPVSISADGQYVCFESRATNLTSGTDTNSNSSFNGYDLFVKNMATGMVTRLTSTAAGNAGNAELKTILSVSPDGNRIAFTSTASDLGAGTDTNGLLDVFVADIRTGELVRATSNAAGNAASLTGPFAPDTFTQDGGFSADGSVYVFYSPATDIGGGTDTNNVTELFAYDFSTGTLSRVGTTPAGNASASGALGNVGATTQLLGMSNDGKKIVFGSTAADFVGNDTRGLYDLFVKDLDDGSVVRITSRPDGSATAPQAFAAGIFNSFYQFYQGISGDGRYVYFTTSDTELVPDSPKYALNSDLFQYDTTNGAVTHISVSSKGASDFGGAGLLPPAAGVSSDTGSNFALNPVTGAALFISTQTGLTTDSNAYDIISDVYLYTPDPAPTPIDGGEDGETLSGGAGADIMNGLGGDDTLDGGAGKDTLDGGDGNDTADYSSQTAAVVVTLAGATAATVSVGGVAEDKLRNIENLIGGSGNDTLGGDAADNHLQGAGGNDALTGAGGIDTLEGGTGNDTLDGGTGADILIGGDGADVYAIDDLSDLVTEDSADASVGGIDEVRSALVAYTLGQHLENGRVTRSAGASLTGNALANTLFGSAGADTLNGATGVDTLQGGAGSDVYVVDLTTDKVIETTTLTGSTDAGGRDTVRSSVSYALGVFVEDLALLGSNAINATGNAAANRLTGNAGANRLLGGAGADTLIGGAGNDTIAGGVGRDRLTGGLGNDRFVFDALPNAANLDTLTDFTRAADRILLDDDVFTKLGVTGTLTGAALGSKFVANTTGQASSSSHRIIYETDTGKLLYDVDGTGGTAAVQFALLTKGLGLKSTDFLVVS